MAAMKRQWRRHRSGSSGDGGVRRAGLYGVRFTVVFVATHGAPVVCPVEDGARGEGADSRDQGSGVGKGPWLKRAVEKAMSCVVPALGG